MLNFVDWYTSEDIHANEDQYYVFGDNAERRGFGGQAKAARGHINSIGVVTKMLPEHGTPKCYMHDANFFNNIAIINADLDIVERRLKEGKVVNWPRAHIGTERARLQEFAPRTFQYISLALLALCDKYGYTGKLPDVVAASLPGEGARLLTENEVGSSPTPSATTHQHWCQSQFPEFPQGTPCNCGWEAGHVRHDTWIEDRR